MTRLATHSFLAEIFARYSDDQLASHIAKVNPLHTGVGGTSVHLTIEGIPVFVKKIPLTDLERQPENREATANLFNLPTCCHYGFSGPSANAWRELAANQMATNWVTYGACQNFPLLYHWRVLLSSTTSSMTAAQREDLEFKVRFWDNSPAVRAKLEATQGASAHLVLFSEYIPQNLLEWLSAQLGKDTSTAEAAISFVEKHLGPTINFMQSKGFTHFDPHFENIMTDGKRLYFSDFGLALSTEFTLTEVERHFLAEHPTYDHARSAVGYMHCLSTALLGTYDWKDQLRKYLKAGVPQVAPQAAAALTKYAPLALTLLEFSRQFREESKQAAYPAEQFKRLLS